MGAGWQLSGYIILVGLHQQTAEVVVPMEETNRWLSPTMASDTQR
jgi:hypothetical protein